MSMTPDPILPANAATGDCSICGRTFDYNLIHNGFNESAYAYCDTCGMTSILSGLSPDVPPAAGYRGHQRIVESVEPFLTPCGCDGRFTATAGPRCSHCHSELDAEAVRESFERNAPGTRLGWRWQRNWSGLYAIVVDGRVVWDNWRHREPDRTTGR
jgi:hypothetical protein